MKRRYFVCYLFDLGDGGNKFYDGIFEIDPLGTDLEDWKTALREQIYASTERSIAERARARTDSMDMVIVNFFELH